MARRIVDMRDAPSRPRRSDVFGLMLMQRDAQTRYAPRDYADAPRVRTRSAHVYAKAASRGMRSRDGSRQLRKTRKMRKQPGVRSFRRRKNVDAHAHDLRFADVVDDHDVTQRARHATRPQRRHMRK